MNDLNPTAFIDSIVAIARQAGERIMAIYAGPVAIQHKADHSPLTNADQAAHEHIVASLGALTPTIPVISEESGAEVSPHRASWPTLWLVDPLDGTKEFIKRSGEFTVNIALIHNHQPILGVIYAPAIDTLYFGSINNGSYKQLKNSPVTPIRVSAWPQDGRIRVVSSKEHGVEKLQAALTAFPHHSQIGIGSSLKFCLIAEGAADLYLRLGPTSEWDTAAGQAILEAAGGCVRSLAGDALTYNSRASLLNTDFIALGDPQIQWPHLTTFLKQK